MEFKVGDKVKLISLDYTKQFMSMFLYESMYQVGQTFIVESYDPNDDVVYDENLYKYATEDLEKVVDVNYIIAPNAITVSYSGNLETVAKGDHRYSALLEAIVDDRIEDLPDLVNVQKSFDIADGVDLIDGHIHIKGKRIPEVLNSRVLDFKAKGLPYDALIKFAEKLMLNPSFNSREMLYKFLEHTGHPITKDGNFIAYKKVTEDFLDCHTQSIDNSVGKVVEMSREEVDDNPNNTCSSGLHVAAYQYADGFSSGHLILVEVDPQDVVSIPVDYDGQKMRVCKYAVKEVCKYAVKEVCKSILNEELYEDSHYNDVDFDYEDEDDYWGALSNE